MRNPATQREEQSPAAQLRALWVGGAGRGGGGRPLRERPALTGPPPHQTGPRFMHRYCPATQIGALRFGRPGRLSLGLGR